MLTCNTLQTRESQRLDALLQDETKEVCTPFFNYSLRPSLLHRPPGCVPGNKDDIARLPHGLQTFEHA